MARTILAMLAVFVMLVGCGGGSGAGDSNQPVEDSRTEDVGTDLLDASVPDVGSDTVLSCGDGVCSVKEDCVSCPKDCGECPDTCGNGACADGETCETCASDCGVCPECPDGTCNGEEDCETCPADCGVCQPDCGDGLCRYGETCEKCPLDCGDCPTECGDGSCVGGETCSSCPEDCGECPIGCGDANCSPDENCQSCPQDCGPCQSECGDSDVTGLEECDDGGILPGDGCSPECMFEDPVNPGDVIITEIMKNPAVVDDTLGEWFEIYNTTDHDISINGWVISDAGVDHHKILISSGLIIMSHGYLVLGHTSDKLANGGVDIDYMYGPDVNLSNKDDEINLIYNEIVIDSVSYDDGVTFPDPLAVSMSLDPDAYDAAANDLGSSWCESPDGAYGLGDFGSPGAANGQCLSPVLCPNGQCDFLETCASCPLDCGECPFCGDSVCEGGENCLTCPDDCGECPGFCGDGYCKQQETCASCPSDCGACCGNQKCDFGETCFSCASDCGACCPNGICEPNFFESCSTCEDDCGVCSTCGNSTCDMGESCVDCEKDCGQCPVTGWCRIFGSAGEKKTCSLRLAADGLEGNRAVALSLDMHFDSDRVTFSRFVDEFCSGGSCVPWSIPPQTSLQPTGHAVGTSEPSTGVQRLIVYEPGGANKPITQAYMDEYGYMIGESAFLEVEFELLEDVSEQNGVDVVFLDITAADYNATELFVRQMPDGLIVTSPDSLPVCGDSTCSPAEPCWLCPDDCPACESSCFNGICEPYEDCSICQFDCGECVVCGDGECTPGVEDCASCADDCGECVICGDSTCTPDEEDCQSCSLDCGVCPCGDGFCASDENCSTCQADCGLCPACPDGACNGNETCISCEADCGTCPAVCGDDLCNGNETCSNCSGDCGSCPAECGNSLCESPEEYCMNCATDCGSCPAECGNLACEIGETCVLCPLDCGVCPCGDGDCAADEDCSTCSLDCGQCPTCGDGACNGDEGCQSCSEDCGECPAFCGDGACNGEETCLSCLLDCGACPPACGDLACNGTETCSSCPGDCGVCPCGNGVCASNETCSSCPADCGPCPYCGDGACNGTETCSTCQGDCGECPPPGWCPVYGTAGTTRNCDLRIVAGAPTSPRATAIEFFIEFDGAKVEFMGFHDQLCAGTCVPWDTPPNYSIQPSGHSIAFEPMSPGIVKAIIYHATMPEFAISPAYLNGTTTVGDPKVVELVFQTKSNITPPLANMVVLNGLLGSDKEGNQLNASMVDGVVITVKP